MKSYVREMGRPGSEEVGVMWACFRSTGRVRVRPGWIDGGVQEVKELGNAMVTPRFLVHVAEQKEGAVTKIESKGGGEVWGKRMSPHCRCLGI